MAAPRTLNDGWRCGECCNGDRCDDPTHVDRKNCKHCFGTGIAVRNMYAKEREVKDRIAALEAELAKVKAERDAALKSERDKNAHLKQLLFRAYDYVGVPDDNHSIWGPIRAVLVARKEGE